MTQLKAFLTISLLFIYLSAFGQIEKGNYNFGGDVELNGSLSKRTGYNSTNFTASISPSISKFLTNHWLVGIRPIIANQTQKIDLISSNSADKFTLKSNDTRLGLALSSRYYLPINSKFSLFGLVDAAYSYKFSNTSLISRTDNIKSNKNERLLNYQVGVGANVALNKDVFFETTLSYIYTEITDAPLFIPLLSLGGASSFVFNTTLNHFISRTKKTDKNETTPQYIHKGRRILDGNIQIWKTDKFINVQLLPQYGGFVSDNILLTGKLFYANLNSDYFQYEIGGAIVTARYYAPLNQRFFLYPQLSYMYRATSSGSDVYKNSINIAAGGSYFLSSNVALDMTFLQTDFYLLSKQNTDKQTLSSTFGVGRIGLLYFIR